MDAQPTVSVIIPAYNSEKTIGKTLDHLLRQTADANLLEIVVVDSSSEESSKTQLAKYEKEHEKIRYMVSGVRVMPAIQRNIGAKNASGDLLCFIDSDAYPAPDWIEKIIETYQQGWRVGGGSYGVPDFQRNSKLAHAQYYLEFNEYIDSGAPRIKRLLPTCNLFCERKLFEEVGGIPEIRASEDSLFGLKVSQKAPVRYNPAIRVYHIFRDNPQHFMDNQQLLGKYIYVYRKYYFNSFYLNGFWPLALHPVLITAKFVRIFARIVKAGPKHTLKFFWSSGLFMAGLCNWSKGFRQGRKLYTSLVADFIEKH